MYNGYCVFTTYPSPLPNKIQDSFKIQDYISQQKLHPLYDTQNKGT